MADMDSLRVYVVTYNVAATFPNLRINLADLLALQPGADDALPHLYAIGRQEVKSQPQNYVYDYMFDDPWAILFKASLAARGYVRLRSARLQGIVLSVFVRRELLLHVRDIEESYVRLGLGGLWGNKGAVAVRMEVMGVSLCLVNSHLAAHDHLLEERVINYTDVLSGATFERHARGGLLAHDYLVWLGDLNFRVATAPDAPDDDAARRMAAEHDLTPLLALDQLRQVRQAGRAFAEFAEPTLTFKPTYKLVPGRRGAYAASRRPAWTDRVLYRVRPGAEATLAMEPDAYQSHPSYTDSDHQPVSAQFTLRVRAGPPPPTVEFLPIAEWVIGDDCVAKYRPDAALERSAWDWVALFRAGFAAVDEYLAYVWAPRAASSPGSEHYVVVFPDDCITVPGTYVLVYFGRNGRGVYGISEPFPVHYAHSLARQLGEADTS